MDLVLSSRPTTKANGVSRAGSTGGKIGTPYEGPAANGSPHPQAAPGADCIATTLVPEQLEDEDDERAGRRRDRDLRFRFLRRLRPDDMDSASESDASSLLEYGRRRVRLRRRERRLCLRRRERRRRGTDDSLDVSDADGGAGSGNMGEIAGTTGDCVAGRDTTDDAADGGKHVGGSLREGSTGG